MPLKAVPPAPLGDGADEFGSVVEAVQTQIDDLGVQGDRPGLCAAALAMARILDNPVALPQHPAAAGRLVGWSRCWAICLGACGGDAAGWQRFNR